MAAFGGGATVKAAEPKIMPAELKTYTRTLTDEDIERLSEAIGYQIRKSQRGKCYNYDGTVTWGEIGDGGPDEPR